MSSFARKGKDDQIRKMIKDEKNNNIDVSAPEKVASASTVAAATTVVASISLLVLSQSWALFFTRKKFSRLL